MRFGEEFSHEYNDLSLASDIVNYIFGFIPSYSLSYSILALVSIQASNNVCINNIENEDDTLMKICTNLASEHNRQASIYEDYLPCCIQEFVPPKIAICSDHCISVKSPFSFDRQDGINDKLLFLMGTCILYMGILILIEFGIIQKIKTKLGKSKHVDSMTTTTNLDKDVIEEKQRVHSLMNEPQQKSDVLLVNDLFKKFGKFTAVSGLNFGVKPGECFGLLGVNGAGKTTSFRMYVS